jgi:aldose 1-epimerase
MGEQTIVPITGGQLRISSGDYYAVITELGAGLREFGYRGQPAVTGFDPDELPPAGSGQLLAPWPNRIEDGRYTFGATSYQLDLNEPARGNAIHGLTRWAGWQVTAQAEGVAQLGLLLCGRPGYPFCLELTARYRLDAQDGLEVTIIARNAGSRPAPYGTGSHPYLTAGSRAVDDCQLTLPAARWLETDERGIPRGLPQDVDGTQFDFRQSRPIGTTQLDHPLTALTRDADGRARARLATGPVQVTLWAGEGYRWLQVFTGDALAAGRRRRALAIEPMTCPPNAFASGIDLITLEPGQSVSHNWGLQVSHG